VRLPLLPRLPPPLMVRRRKWIKRAVRRRGRLHRDLRVPAGRKIPTATLRRAAKRKGKIGQRARLALRLRGYTTKRRRGR
jgi:hypothetical protein